MQIFNIVEELEKERKKNKTLEYKVQELNAVIEYQKNQLKEYKDIQKKLNHAETTAYNKNKIISKMQKNIINKAIEYLNEAIEDTDIAEVINTDELLNILKGDNK